MKRSVLPIILAIVSAAAIASTRVETRCRLYWRIPGEAISIGGVESCAEARHWVYWSRVHIPRTRCWYVQERSWTD